MQCLGTCFHGIWEDRWATAACGTLAHLFPLPGTHAPCAAYEKGGQFEKALKTFQHQLDAKVDPDLITFSSLVSACVRAGETRGEAPESAQPPSISRGSISLSSSPTLPQDN